MNFEYLLMIVLFILVIAIIKKKSLNIQRFLKQMDLMVFIFILLIKILKKLAYQILLIKKNIF